MNMKPFELTTDVPEELTAEQRREQANARARVGLVVFTLILQMAAMLLFGFVTWSDWRTGFALNLVQVAIFGTFAYLRMDRLMVHLIFFGLIVGVIQLNAGAWLVEYTGTLDYSIGGGPFLWRSPFWLIVAWQVIAIQFAVLGGWLWERWQGAGLILTGLLGAMYLAFYEHLAYGADWWAYSGCSMVGRAPDYVILSEFFIVMAMAILYKVVEARRATETFKAGVLGGVDILVCFAAAYSLWSVAGL